MSNEIRDLKCDICEAVLGTLELPAGLPEAYWQQRLKGQICDSQECHDAYFNPQPEGE